jgi:hypothetical protein
MDELRVLENKVLRQASERIESTRGSERITQKVHYLCCSPVVNRERSVDCDVQYV